MIRYLLYGFLIASASFAALDAVLRWREAAARRDPVRAHRRFLRDLGRACR